VTSHTGHLIRERVELVDHGVDGVLELEDLALDVDGDLLGEVAVLDCGRDLGDVAHLARQVARSEDRRVGKVLRYAGDALDVGLVFRPVLGGYVAGDTGHLVREGVELVDHRVDGVLELEDLAPDVDGDLLREVAVGDSGGDFGDIAHLARQVAGHEVDVVGQVLPDAADAPDLGLTAQLALGAHLARHAGHLAREGVELADHRVDGPRRVEELAVERPSIDLERHGLRQVAIGDGADDARDLGVRPGQVFGQVVDSLERGGPRAGAPTRCDTPDRTFVTDLAAETADLALQTLVRLDDRVEGGGDLAGGARPLGRHAGGKIA